MSITKDKNNYRHLSVGRKLKNHIFWSAINQYDKEEKDYNEIAHIKGLYSFVLSIEKNGVENGYSDKMKSLLVERGYETLKQLLSSLGNDELNKNESWFFSGKPCKICNIRRSIQTNRSVTFLTVKRDVDLFIKANLNAVGFGVIYSKDYLNHK